MSLNRTDMTIESDHYSLDLLTEQLNMDTNNCTIDVQFGTTLSVNSVIVRACQTLVEALRFILFHNKVQNNNHILTDNDARIFDVIEQFSECPQKMFTILIKHFTELYDIDLYIINFDGKKFDIFNKDSYLKENSKVNVTFLSFNEDNTICGPLCGTIDNETIHTVFSYTDLNIWHYVDDYLEEVNKSKLQSTINSTQMAEHRNMVDSQDFVENSTMNHVSILENQSNLANSIQADDKAESRALIEQMLKPLFHLFNSLSLKTETINSIIHSSAFNLENFEHLSRQEIFTALKHQFNCLLNLVENEEQSISILQNDESVVHQSVFPDDTNNQLIQTDTSVEMDYALQVIPLSTNTSVMPSPTRVSKNIEVTIASIPSESPPLTIILHLPKILTHPKDEWHPRTIQELKAHKNPLLSGEGPQRTPIRIKVPREGEIPTYLGVAVLTYDNQDHISKVAVAENTKVKPNYHLKDNNLDCLEFDELGSMTVFNRKTRYNYLKISSEEHKVRLKEVRLHIFNLYQCDIITKQLIKEKQLNLFKLAFWFCFCQDGEYKRVSPISVTQTIREKYVVNRIVRNSSGENSANNS